MQINEVINQLKKNPLKAHGFDLYFDEAWHNDAGDYKFVWWDSPDHFHDRNAECWIIWGASLVQLPALGWYRDYEFWDSYEEFDRNLWGEITLTHPLDKQIIITSELPQDHWLRPGHYHQNQSMRMEFTYIVPLSLIQNPMRVIEIGFNYNQWQSLAYRNLPKPEVWRDIQSRYGDEEVKSWWQEPISIHANNSPQYNKILRSARKFKKQG
ncbi:hypothetical protein HC928_06930 [bacterium]|nr:hypothetical protein [bacterium]